jgi:hypothetical protein
MDNNTTATPAARRSLMDMVNAIEGTTTEAPTGRMEVTETPGNACTNQVVAPKTRPSVTLQVCWRCNGRGIYYWGAVVNGKPTFSGDCFKCVGGGEFKVTSGAAWFTKYGKQILASIERMAHAGAPSGPPADSGRRCVTCNVLMFGSFGHECAVCVHERNVQIGRSMEAMVSGPARLVEVEELTELLATQPVTHTRYRNGHIYVYVRDDSSPTGVMCAGRAFDDCPEINALLRNGLAPLSPTEKR